MNAIRQKKFEENLEGLDEETKNIYRIAELICRREFEKEFNFNLDLPLGHPQNLIPIINKNDNRKVLLDVLSFWMSIKDKYLAKLEDPLASAIAYFCDIHVTGMYKRLHNV